MKLVLLKGHLKDALASVAGISTENQNLPILKNVLISADNGTITVCSTNLEIAISYFVPGKIIEPGKITVPASTFLQIISNLTSERVNIEEKNGVLEVKTDNYEATLQGISAEEFPIIPTIKEEKGSLSIKGILLKEALSQVSPSAQISDLRPELGSLLFSFGIDTLKLAATDSFRLAEKTFTKTQMAVAYKDDFKLLVPLKTAQELLKILNDDEDVVLKDDGSQILIETPRFSMISRLIDGKFPDYEAIIPKDFSAKIILDSSEFVSALKLSAVFGSKISEVRIKILDNKKGVQIYSQEQGLGENSSTLSAKAEGNISEISFNWRYLLDGLRALKGKEVWIGLNEDNKPALLKVPNDSSYFYIVMPIMRA